MILKFKSTINYLITKFHLLWVIFYLLLFGGALLLGDSLYKKHDQDILPSGNIELLVNKTNYQLGETVEFTVVNHFPTTIYVTNQCPAEPLNVYKWQNNEWVQIHDTARDEDSECFSQERNVGIIPGGTRGYNFKDWKNLFKEPGVYRIAMVVQHSDDILFQDFTILEPAKVIEVKTSNSMPSSEITPTTSNPKVEDNIIQYEEDDEGEEDDD